MAKIINSKEEFFKNDGARITCIIDDTVIKNARIRLEDGQGFICQNEQDGEECDNKHGFKYSHSIGSQSSNNWHYAREIVINGDGYTPNFADTVREKARVEIEKAEAYETLVRETANDYIATANKTKLVALLKFLTS